MPSPLLVFLACAPLGAMAAFHHLSKPPISPRIPKSGGEKRDGRPKPLSLVDPPSIDPFFNRTRVLPLRVRLCMSVMAVTVFPLRLLAMVVCLLSIAVICHISILGMDEASLKKPLPRWRRKLREPVYPAMRLFWWLLGFTNIHVKGRPAPTKTTPIVIANHQSLVDTMLLPILRATPVSKIENRRMPVVGTIGHAMQVLFVDRSSAASRAETMRALRQRATDPTFPRTLLFPEGTCTNGSVLARFKRGAFTPGVPVQPVIVKYPFATCDPAFVRAGPRLGSLVFRLGCTLHNPVTVEFLPPYFPSAAERNDAELFATNVRSLMAACMGVPATNHSYDDVRLMTEALHLRMPPEVASLEMATIEKRLGISVDQCSQLLKSFHRMGASHSGVLTPAQFAAGIQAGGGSATQEEAVALFRLFDANSDGVMEYRDLVIGAGLFLAKDEELRTTALEAAFDVFHAAEAGRLHREWFRRLLRRGCADVDDNAAGKLWQELNPSASHTVTKKDFVRFGVSRPGDVRRVRDVLLGRALCVG